MADEKQCQVNPAGQDPLLAFPGLASMPHVRMSVPEIAERLRVGRRAVYEMLAQRIIPGVRFGHRWIVTRNAYERWEQTCGTRPL